MCIKKHIFIENLFTYTYSYLRLLNKLLFMLILSKRAFCRQLLEERALIKKNNFFTLSH